ncbi:MAG: hypothetical protein PHY93_08915 [Bacteriovorax sp.]|nr:hypothetical protein [Bacteriovorax sp.]
MFNVQSVNVSGLAAKLPRLIKKHQGGASQKKGQRYEDYFSLYKIAKSSAEIFKGTLKDAEILDQAQYSFVDDLVIKKSKNKLDYYQLKNTKDLSWNKELLADFEDQDKLASHAKANFSLVLVVSNAKVFNKLSNMPSNTSKKTFIKLFPEPINCQDMVDNFVGFSVWMKEISAKRNPSTMDLDTLAKNIQSEWINLSCQKFTGIKKLLEISNRESVPVRTEWISTSKWKKARAILNKIPNLAVYTDRGIFEYEFILKGATSDGFFQASPDSKKAR